MSQIKKTTTKNSRIKMRWKGMMKVGSLQKGCKVWSILGEWSCKGNEWPAFPFVLLSIQIMISTGEDPKQREREMRRYADSCQPYCKAWGKRRPSLGCLKCVIKPTKVMRLLLLWCSQFLGNLVKLVNVYIAVLSILWITDPSNIGEAHAQLHVLHRSKCKRLGLLPGIYKTTT